VDKQAILDCLDKKAFYASQLSSFKANGSGMGQGLCPFHKDTKPSLSVNLNDGHFHCFGCGEKGSVFDFYMKQNGVDFVGAKDALANVAGIATEPKKKILRTYDYTDEAGKLLCQTVRYDPKDFKQRRPDGRGGWIYDLHGVRLVPYHLPEVLKEKSVIIVEGEKDADNLETLGLTATTSPMGAGKWRKEYNEHFKEKHVAILPDNDDLGKKHAQAIAGSLHRVAESMKVVELPGLPHKGDVSDWISQEGTKEALIELIKQTPEWVGDETLVATPENSVAQEASTTKSIRVVSLPEMLSMEFPPRENILCPWLPTQGIGMIYSIRGTGKTHVALGISVAVASGGRFLRWEAPQPRGVMYVDGEMPAVVIQERLSHIIASLDKEPSAPLHIVTPDLQKSGMPDLSTYDGQMALEPHLDGVSLVIVDNISTLCRGGRENEAESWLPVQGWALRLRTRGKSVLFIHHSGKGGLQRGTSRREDVLDTVINLKRPGDYRPDEGARFEVHFEKARGIYGENVKPFEAKLITGIEGKQEWGMKDLEESLTERVADLLNQGVPQQEIAEMIGVAKGTVSKHKRKAQDAGLLTITA